MARLERQRVQPIEDKPANDPLPGPGVEEPTTKAYVEVEGHLKALRGEEDERPTVEESRQDDAPEIVSDPSEVATEEGKVIPFRPKREDDVQAEQASPSELEQLRSQLQSERLRIVDALQNDLKWYDRFSKMYQQQKEWLAHVDSALAQASQLEGRDAQTIASDIEDLRAAFEEKVGFSHPEEVADPMLVGWEDFDQFVEVQERGEPQMKADVFGTPKNRTEKDLEKAGVLGEFGQDGSVINESTGTAVAFDGSTSGGSESYRVTHLIAKKVEEILSGLPEGEDDPGRINAYIQSRFQEVHDMLDWLPRKVKGAGMFDGEPQDVQGAGMFVATRLLKDSGMLVSVRLGDGYMAMKQGDAAAEPLMADERELFIQRRTSSYGDVHIERSTPLGIGVKMSAVETKVKRGLQTESEKGSARQVFMRDPAILVQKVDLSQGPLRVALCSDGLDALVKSPSGGKETPQAVLDKGGTDYLRQEGVVQHPREKTKDDDLAYVMVEYSAGE